MELTEQHLALLRTAATAADGLLQCPERLVGVVRRRMADRLLDAGVAEAVAAENDQPHWFRREKGGFTALRITASGRALASTEADRRDDEEADTILPLPVAEQVKGHRLGTKRALLIDLLGREDGATLAVLVGATGWQPHTIRAALTRLRQDGLTIRREPGENGTTYRLTETIASKPSAVAGADA